VLTVYVLLLVVFPSAYTLGAYDITPAMIVGLLAGLLWFGSRCLEPYLEVGSRSSPARRGVLGLLAATFISYYVAMSRPLGDVLVGSADRKMVALLAVVGVALLACDGIRNRAELYRVLGVIVAAGAALAAIGILQYTVGFDLASRLRPPGLAVEGSGAFVYTRGGLARVAGTARHPIEFGIACAMILPVAAHLSWFAPTPRGRLGAKIAATLLAIAIPMALSRSAVLGVLAAALVVTVGWQLVKLVKVVVAGSIVAWVTSWMAPGVLPALESLFLSDAADPSDAARERSRQEALTLIRERPLFGRGVGTLQGIIVDNQYLATLVESGVFGLLAVALLLNGAILAARRSRVADDERSRDLAFTVISVVAAFLAGSLGLATLIYPLPAGLLFVTAGLAGAAHRIARTPDGPPRSPARTSHRRTVLSLNST
jgi:O-antigen ligase